MISLVFSTASPTPKYRLIFLESLVGEGGRKKGIGLGGTATGELVSLKFVALGTCLKFLRIFGIGRLTYLGALAFTRRDGNCS